ncbi:hypothetical protein ACFE04_026556 [Oxalis oulophora]
MGFWTLFEVASMPILQVLIISLLGAFMATDYLNLLHADARRSLNKIVFLVFTPSLMFASLAKTVTLQDIISWWFMPVNVGLTFLFGGILGWIVVKVLRPPPYLEGNLGNLVLIIIPAICNEEGSPFGSDHNACKSIGLSYASFSMALGGFYIWTYTFSLVKSSALKYKALQVEEARLTTKEANKDLEANAETHLLNKENSTAIELGSSHEEKAEGLLSKLYKFIYQIFEELMAPPTVAAVVGLTVGSITWLRKLIIGDDAPLRVIQDSVKLLGDGTIPCITLILGGNLIQGLRKSQLKFWVIVGVVCVRYVMLPVVGISVVKAAASVGFLPSEPLYQFVLMIQFALPPAMNIGTMTQLFDVAQEECSVLFLWTYLVAALALTMWSTVFMWILS